LLENGYKVRVLDSLFFGKEPLDPVINNPNFDLIVGRIEDPYIVEKAVRGMDSVIHLAGLANDPCCDLSPDATQRINYEATKKLLDYAKKANVSRFIFASSCSIYGDAQGCDWLNETSPTNFVTLYAKAKFACEKAITEASSENFETVCLRKGTIYGLSPRMRFDLVANIFIAKSLNEGIITVNGGEQWRPIIHVSDIVNAYILTLEASSEKVASQIFNVGSNEQNYQMIQLAKMIQELVPNTKMEVTGTNDARSYHVSFDKIAKSLGFKAEKTVRDAVDEIKEAFDKKIITNYKDINYYNIGRMVYSGLPI